MLSTDRSYSLGILVLRVSFACLMLTHGLQKVYAFSAMSTSFPDPIGLGSQLSLILAIGAEVGCSLLVAAGLFTRMAAIPVAVTMMVAALIVHASDPWQKKELAVVYLVAFLVILITGAGRYS